MFDVDKKKKRKYNRKQVMMDETEDGSAFEDLIRSLANYKRLCPTHTSGPSFSHVQMRALLMVRNVRCTIRCCVPSTTDELEGVPPDPPCTSTETYS